jgi:signal transduction histidine kinase
MELGKGNIVSEKNNLKIILFFIILTTALTIGVILLWEKVLLRPFYSWVDSRYPGVENAERRRLIQQRTEHFFISVTVDGIVVTLLLGVVRRQQRRLSESEERYRLLFEHASDGIGVISVPDFRIVQVNLKFCEILGYTSQDMVDRDLRELATLGADGTTSESLVSWVDETIQQIKDGNSPNSTARPLTQLPIKGMLSDLYVRLAAFVVSSESEWAEHELSIKTPTGIVVPVSASFSTLAARDEHLVIVIIRDLSERKRLEVEKAEMQVRLMHNEKISALGRVAAQVAHEVKNPLAGLRLYSLHLKTKVAGKLSEGEMDIVNKIADGIGRLTETTEQILSFARPINLALTTVNLNKVVSDTAQLLEPQAQAKKLRVNLELAEPALMGMLDEASIHAALMNLMLNAIQAMPEEGILTVSTSLKRGTLLITIEDTGKGMSDEQIKNVFEPFYTTRAQGLGLGMPYAKKVIEQHQGSIHVESQVGKGTRVEIELPVTETKG